MPRFLVICLTALAACLSTTLATCITVLFCFFAGGFTQRHLVRGAASS